MVVKPKDREAMTSKKPEDGETTKSVKAGGRSHSSVEQ